MGDSSQFFSVRKIRFEYLFVQAKAIIFLICIFPYDFFAGFLKVLSMVQKQIFLMFLLIQQEEKNPTILMQ